jgi:hypothetical protein
LPRLKLISAVRNRGGVARTYFDTKLGERFVIPTFDGRLYGGGGDMVFIAPLCTILKYYRAKTRPPWAPKPNGPGKRPPAAPRGGGRAA